MSMTFNSKFAPRGQASFFVKHPYAPKHNWLGWVIRNGLPRPGLNKEVNTWRFANLPHLWRGLWRVVLGRTFRVPHFYGMLQLAIKRADGQIIDYGLVSFRVVTTAGVNFIVDAFQNSVEVETMKYHGLGTGSTAEAAGDTALVTELTTEYTGNVRATGTTTEGASANIYRTVATNTLDGTPGAALREHGIFSADSAGTLLDRSVYSSITLSSGDALQSTFDLTISAGS